MGSSGRPAPCTLPDVFPAAPELSLSLSLSLAGPFGQNEQEPAVARGDVVEGGGGIRGGGLRPGEAAEISSENIGQGSQSGGARSGEEAGHEDAGSSKKRKGYYRHTVQQTCVLEAAFKESANPDETQRQQLSEQLGLSALQVKYWFQNRRSQAKVTEDRHANSLLKSQLDELQTQLDNLKEENRALRELINSSRCPARGAAAAANTDEQQLLLRLDNAKLNAEVERLSRALGNNAAALLTSPSSSTGGIQIGSRNSLDNYVNVGHDDKTKKFLELAGRALDELMAMCSSGQPLWVRSAETGRDVLNCDEYARLFQHHDDHSGDRRAVWLVEASRATGVVAIGATRLVGAFVDANQWKEMFPSMIAKALTLEVIHAGGNDHLDGIVQLMSAEVQTLTPLVPTRKLYFLRHYRKLGTNKWAIVDVSLDNFERPGAQTSSTLGMCLKKPSGCIIEENSLGRLCKVTWVEHAKCRVAAVPSMHRTVTESGLAFGARRWVAALQLQCERMAFAVATNIPTWGLTNNGAAAGGGDALLRRQSVLTLAQRMTSSLYRVIGASRDLPGNTHGGASDIRVMSWWSTGEPGEPRGLIASAVLPVWLPVSPAALLGFLGDESRRHEWDAVLPLRSSVHSCVTVPRGGDRGNYVEAYAVKNFAGEMISEWRLLQDSSTGPCESTVAYSPVDAVALWLATCGHDSSAVAVLPCGIVVMPDGLEARPPVITSRQEEEEDGGRTAVESGGSLVTLVFQVLANSPARDPVESAADLASRTLAKIKKALRCGD